MVLSLSILSILSILLLEGIFKSNRLLFDSIVPISIESIESIAKNTDSTNVRSYSQK